MIGKTIPAGGSVSATYEVSKTEAGVYGNEATVTVKDDEGNPASDTDKETIEVTDVTPTIDVTKDVTPASLAEPGGVFTYTVTVKNTSVEAVKVTSVADSGVSPLPAELSALLGQTIPAGGSISASYSVTKTEPGVYPNTATVTAEDNEGNPATDADSESVSVSDVPPAVDLVKSVTPASANEPQGVFTYTLTITNKSVEPVTITALTDTNINPGPGRPYRRDDSSRR